MAGSTPIIYGPRPGARGGADEYVLVEELMQVAQVHALTALGFLVA
jgi:hypothetical protein